MFPTAALPRKPHPLTHPSLPQHHLRYPFTPFAPPQRAPRGSDQHQEVANARTR
ncbi:hypothetical protein HMPREF0058_1124 [Actinomyces urogenitalis DSM 15434]|uniref:Uncharacterized protein n=1 Tax=Actinomyces urogenitalis DSM 15434 TaxID=525246 RepID=C0W5I0_9ACTO|nr:hypothetical protein HMPREF0058_1124 [Actinomyces urogenitalis DSM 15434]